jgi:predicted nucleic acid-binding OB-fold protein
LLPGLGKKTMQGIIGCRPFVTFQEIEDKVQGFKNPVKHISARIEHEIKVQEQKYRLFVR